MGLHYKNPPLQPFGQGMLNRPPTVPLGSRPPYTSPPIPGGGALGVLGLITTAVSVIGLLGGDQFRDTQLAKLGKGYDQNTGLSSSLNPNTGSKEFSLPPPFTGGQSLGVTYHVTVRVVTSFKDGSSNTADVFINGIQAPGTRGPVTGLSIEVNPVPGSPKYGQWWIWLLCNNSSNQAYARNFSSGLNTNIQNIEATIISISRADGQPDTGGNPPGTPLGTGPSGYTGGESLEELQRRSLRAVGLAGLNGFSSVEPRAGRLGTEANPKALLPPPNGSPLDPVAKNPLKSPSASPIKSPVPAIPSPVTPPSPQPPSSDDDIQTKLVQLIGITTLINSNTQPSQQRNNAKEGTCDALQSPQCTQGMEDRIKNPIMDNVDATKAQTVANAGAISSVASLLATVWDFLQNKIGKVLNILNNSVIDRTLAVMNLATNIHNAAMLTRDLGETLGSVVDNVIGLTGLRFTNSEGAQVQFTDFLSSNFRAFLVSVLGAENYVSLVLQWQKANTIYHSAMAVVNTTQSMLDPISSAVEYGMENVSKIGNSLKEDGVVSENAYPAMDETIRARRVNRFERLNDTLEGAENIASNLSSITSSAVSVKEDYKQLREDSKDLKDKASAFNTADSEARAALKAELPTEITAITLAPAPAEDEE